MKQGIEGIENNALLVGCVYNLGLSLVSPCFGTRAVRPSVALLAARFVPPPPTGRPSAPGLPFPGLAHCPSTRPPRSLVLTITYARIRTDAGIERARIVCPADYPQTDNNDEQ
eukprot:scaffold49220_cov57-Phaeocystis_antarctica.AAC.4